MKSGHLVLSKVYFTAYRYTNTLAQPIDPQRSVELIFGRPADQQLRKNLVSCINFSENSHIDLTFTKKKVMVLIQNTFDEEEKKLCESIFASFYHIVLGLYDLYSKCAVGD